MNSYLMKMALLLTSVLLITGCISTPIAPQADVQVMCSNLAALNGDEPHSKAVSTFFLNLSKPENKRKFVIFMDGTGNTELTNTNIWKMYQLSLVHACSGSSVIPFYNRGVGTSWYNTLLGGAFGDGINGIIRRSYQFLVENYREGDEIFIVGFSRGAYSARSLNGLIEYANLLDVNKISKGTLREEVKGIFNAYHTLNDGKPSFEGRLRAKIKKSYAKITRADKVVVSAIGVFDTVAALGLVRDDFPDNHRTNLYAREGFHAMSLDEQRDDFRLLRFDDYDIEPQRLKEVWFPGVHANVGGGYGHDHGLESISRDWMLRQFAKYELFESKQSPLECNQSVSCDSGKMHDEFLDSSMFAKFGISRRRPGLQDFVHQSVICRMNIITLPQPHSKREVIKIDNSEKTLNQYKPFNLRLPVEKNYTIEDSINYQCSYDEAK